jgi:hypothetical protein
MELTERLVETLRQSPSLSIVLGHGAHIGPPDWYIAGGCIPTIVWNVLSGIPPDMYLNDIDIVYYDTTDITAEGEAAAGAELSMRLPGIAVKLDVKNQARVHLWYKDKNGLLAPIEYLPIPIASPPVLVRLFLFALPTPPDSISLTVFDGPLPARRCGALRLHCLHYPVSNLIDFVEERLGAPRPEKCICLLLQVHRIWFAAKLHWPVPSPFSAHRTVVIHRVDHLLLEITNLLRWTDIAATALSEVHCRVSSDDFGSSSATSSHPLFHSPSGLHRHFRQSAWPSLHHPAHSP